jgi:hypothetical protein
MAVLKGGQAYSLFRPGKKREMWYYLYIRILIEFMATRLPHLLGHTMAKFDDRFCMSNPSRSLAGPV